MRKVSKAPFERSQKKRGSATRPFREAMATALDRDSKICQIYFVVSCSFSHDAKPTPSTSLGSTPRCTRASAKRKGAGWAGPGRVWGTSARRAGSPMREAQSETGTRSVHDFVTRRYGLPDYPQMRHIANDAGKPKPRSRPIRRDEFDQRVFTHPIRPPLLPLWRNRQAP